MNRVLILVVLAGLVSAAGCNLRALSLPPDFIKVDKADLGAYTVRGVSADGVVVGLRSEPNPEGGTLGFWTEAIVNRLVRERGYTPAGSEEIRSDGGTPGRLLTFSADRQGTTFTFLVAVYVQGPDILIAEGGGKAGDVEPKKADIRKSLLSVR
jgi:hypothetical protein